MHQMQLKNNMGLLVLFIIFLGLNALLCTTQSNSHSRNISFPVGVVLDLDSPGGRIGLSYLSMALSDFYRVHKNYTTKLVLHVEDSKGLVIDSAASGMRSSNPQRNVDPHTSTQI